MSKVEYGEKVEGPHLALVTSETMEAIAIPPGAMMLIVEDPTRADGVFPIVLLSVSRKHMKFQCGCGLVNCTRTAEMAIKWRGKHPQKTEV